jgi:hypothetical protein
MIHDEQLDDLDLNTNRKIIMSIIEWVINKTIERHYFEQAELIENLAFVEDINTDYNEMLTLFEKLPTKQKQDFLEQKITENNINNNEPRGNTRKRVFHSSGTYLNKNSAKQINEKVKIIVDNLKKLDTKQFTVELKKDFVELALLFGNNRLAVKEIANSARMHLQNFQ